MKKPASSYLRRFHYDTISHDAPLLRYLIDRIGVDRFVLGTDYNMDAGVELPVDFIEDVPGITNEELRLVARDTGPRSLRSEPAGKRLAVACAGIRRCAPHHCATQCSGLISKVTSLPTFSNRSGASLAMIGPSEVSR